VRGGGNKHDQRQTAATNFFFQFAPTANIKPKKTGLSMLSDEIHGRIFGEDLAGVCIVVNA
jgi:hypothetical protein